MYDIYQQSQTQSLPTPTLNEYFIQQVEVHNAKQVVGKLMCLHFFFIFLKVHLSMLFQFSTKNWYDVGRSTSDTLQLASALALGAPNRKRSAGGNTVIQ